MHDHQPALSRVALPPGWTCLGCGLPMRGGMLFCGDADLDAGATVCCLGCGLVHVTDDGRTLRLPTLAEQWRIQLRLWALLEGG
jgi:hypothetical protein